MSPAKEEEQEKEEEEVDGDKKEQREEEEEVGGNASGREEEPQIKQVLVPIPPSNPPTHSVNSLRKRIGVASLSSGSLPPCSAASSSRATPDDAASFNIRAAPDSSSDPIPSDNSSDQRLMLSQSSDNSIINVVLPCVSEELPVFSEEDGENDRSDMDMSDDEDDEDEDANPFANLDVHPIHYHGNSLSMKSFVPKKPVSQPGCKTAVQLAHVLAADSRLLVAKKSAKCCQLHGKLLAAGESFSILVALACSHLVSVAVPRSTNQKELSVIVIVPHPPSERPDPTGQSGDSAGETALPDVLGWVFYCPSQCLNRVIHTLGKAGCYRSGLEDDYRVCENQKAGAGSFGSVIVGFSREHGNIVALKMLKKRTRQSAIDAEVSMLVLAQGHPHIVNFHGCFFEHCEGKGTQWCLIFDYYRGGDLYDRVASGRMTTERDAMPWISHLLSALCFLGERRVFHRDVKPENMLLLGNSGKAVLTDFGIACLTSNTQEMCKTSGTIGYASPEMLQGKATGCEGDAFGAGVVLYFILSKSTPFLAPTSNMTMEKTFECQVNLQYKCFVDISDSCRNLMLQLLKKDISERMTCQEALSMKCIRQNMVTATEPALAMPWEARSLQPGSSHDQPRNNVGAVQAPLRGDFVFPSEGSLPALRRIRHPVKNLHPYSVPVGAGDGQ
eukprot:TRINITY_DN29023_c0_g1_i1.p1 TRINITY_DN29023_c0_g1~~TRINITY_DN29023_c0_g1_i1.p1  ORF type:complete len:671 (+),score=88.73 TRINITY_DN29023_c0_g1_i1:86-2098(+)